VKRLLSLALLSGALALSGAAEAQRPPPAPPVTGVLNLNTATEKQLEDLPAVGPKRAKAILAWRSQNRFLKVEDLEKVKGVGKGIFAKVKDHLSVSGPTTLAKVTPPTH
jgi:competence protein ComEA